MQLASRHPPTVPNIELLRRIYEGDGAPGAPPLAAIVAALRRATGHVIAGAVVAFLQIAPVAGCQSAATPEAQVHALSDDEDRSREEQPKPWEPIDPAFAGCAGACGAGVEGPTAGVVPQPGASVGQSTYCPVSGAVFRVEDRHPHADTGAGGRIYFCCEGCAAYFAQHREMVTRARQM